jgi:exosortase
MKTKARGPELLAPDQVNFTSYIPALIAFVAVLLYAYWPTWAWIESEWRNEPDYSHGYLVPFLAGLLCWHRWDSFPGIRPSVSWAGLSLILLALAMRLFAALTFAPPIDGWSMLPLLAGVVWFVFGSRAMLWSLPAIAFLFLMIPLPFRAESLLSWRLQGVATDLSTIFLRVLGQPAVSEGHVIWLGDQRLMVEQACSGMRIFIGVAALAFFWGAMVKRSWIDRVVMFVLVIPVAVFVNAVRITAVGLLHQVFTDAESQHMIHDISGYLMIPFAFVLLWLLKSYWERIYRPVEQMTAKDMVRKPTASTA